MKGGELHEESQEAREKERLLARSALSDAHRKVKGALRELHLAFEQLDKIKETW